MANNIKKDIRDTFVDFSENKVGFVECFDAFFRTLSIDLEASACEPINFREYYLEAMGRECMPGYLEEINECIKETFFLGTITDEALTENSLNANFDDFRNHKNYEGFVLFGVNLAPKPNGKLYTRTELAGLTRGLNKLSFDNPVIAFIRQGDLLTISTCERVRYVHAIHEIRRGEKLVKVSMLRNIKLSKPHHGHLNILENMDFEGCDTFNQVYDHWQEVFSNEILTDKFYKELFNWYLWATDQDTNISFPNDVSTEDDDHYKLEENIIRLITRIMLVWFIKEKHLVPNNLFDAEYIKTILKDFRPQDKKNGNYYNAILQNLFFATLNRPILDDEGNRRGFAKLKGPKDSKNLYRYEDYFTISESEILDLFSKVPFLNGGLFDCLDKSVGLDGVKMNIDGFSRNDVKFKDGRFKNRAVIPNVYFFDPEYGLLSILKRYQFTVEENTPLDQDVSLDPELLGKVFEQLLGAFNPETKETQRKATGSFYTPREIVQYMVNESIIAHLKNTVDFDVEDRIRAILDYTEEASDVKFSDAETQQILDSIYDCKILDPACGSGAFPMGMLQQLVEILRKIDPENSRWQKFLIERATNASRKAFTENKANKQEILADITRAFDRDINDADYARKLFIIKDCLYGVDLQPIAIQITKLRFFISLIVEQNADTSKPDDNFGIRPLPNLETKFISANTLLEPKLVTLRNSYRNSFANILESDELQQYEKQLRDIRYEHFLTSRASQKRKLREQDEALCQKVNDLIVENTHKDKIAELNAQIAKYKEQLKLYKGVNIQTVEQTDLFGNITKKEVDLNKVKTSEIKSKINNCEAEIRRATSRDDQNFIDAVKQLITDWNPYTANSSADFFEPKWMFSMDDTFEGFDIVIGNPPWIDSSTLNLKDKNYYQSNFNVAVGQFDIFSVFLEKSLSMVKNDCLVSFILPDRFLTNFCYEPTRSYLLNNSQIIELIELGDGIFEKVSMPSAILRCKRSKSINNEVRCKVGLYGEACLKLQNRFKKARGCIFSVFGNQSADDIIDKMQSNSKELSNYLINARGVECGKKATIVKETEGPNRVKFLRGGDIGRYYISDFVYLELGDPYTNYKDDSLYRGSKILIRKTGIGINAVIDYEYRYPLAELVSLNEELTTTTSNN